MTEWATTRRVFSGNPFGFDEIIYQGNDMLVRRSQSMQSVNEILRVNHECRSEGTNGYTPSRDFQRVASIPIVKYYDLTKQYGEGWARDPKKLSQVLRDNPYLKTCEGNV